jgi:hypothetical protein
MKSSKKKVFGSVVEAFEHYVGSRKGMKSEEQQDDKYSGTHLAEDLLKRFQREISRSEERKPVRNRRKRLSKG